MKNFNAVIEASIEELMEFELLGEFESEQLGFYNQAILAHTRGDVEALRSIIPQLEGDFKTLSTYRLEILKQNYSNNEITVEEPFMGEAHFIMGLNFVNFKDYTKAKFHFQKAYQLLWKIDAQRKGIKSLMNMVVSESRHNSNKKLIVDYEFITKKALSIGDKITAGTCQLNISREYQMMGAFELALITCNRALDFLEADMGATHYFFALIHRCHLLIDLKRYPEALIDFQKAKGSSFSEIEEALKVVEVLLGDKKEIDLVHLEPTWKSRLKEHRNGVSFKDLTKTEAQLIKFLSTGPKDKNDIIDEIYGKNMDYESVDSRFRVLLMRLRKKKPSLVVYEQKQYRISDENFLSDIA